MEAIRNKWLMHKTYRRIRKLWDDYLQVAEISDTSVVYTKLNTFLDSFRISFNDFVPGSGQGNEVAPGASVDVDSLFGDCKDILLNLLDMVERVESPSEPSHENKDNKNLVQIAELVNKALNVAELILHDEKYRVAVKDTPNLMGRILSLLDTLGTVENKKVLLRVISALGENPQNKLEIGRLEGFRKILLLLASHDMELTREILKTFKRFLEIRRQGELQSLPSTSNIPGAHLRKSISVSSFGEFARQKIGSVGRLLFTEFHKMFSQTGNATLDRNTTPEQARVASLSADAVAAHNAIFIPSHDAIMAALHSSSYIAAYAAFATEDLENAEEDQSPASPSALESSLAALSESLASTHRPLSPITEVSESRAASPVVTPPAIIPQQPKQEQQTTSESSPPTTAKKAPDDGQLLKDLMRGQGALEALTQSTATQGSFGMMLDLVETIGRLLVHSELNQAEFRNIDGYTFLINLFASSSEEEFASPEGRIFLEDCFGMFFALALDANSNKRVGNKDALQLLFRMAKDSHVKVVQLQALSTIQDIISVNPLNIVDIHSVGGIDTLFELLAQLAKDVHVTDNYLYSNVFSAPSPVPTAPPSPPPTRRSHNRSGSTNYHNNSHSHSRSHSSNSNSNTTAPPTPTSNPESTKRVDKQELIVFVSDLLSYIGVLFSRHNTMVLDGFVNLLLHSKHKVKGHYRISRACLSATASSASSGDNTTSSTSSDSATTDTLGNSECADDKKDTSTSDSPFVPPTSTGEENGADKPTTPTTPTSEEHTVQHTKAEATDICDSDEVTVHGELLVELPYLSIVVLHSISNLLSDIIAHHTRDTPTLLPAFINLLEHLTQRASVYASDNQPTECKQAPLNQWAEQVLVVLQCLGLLVRNPPKSRRSLPPFSSLDTLKLMELLHLSGKLFQSAPQFSSVSASMSDVCNVCMWVLEQAVLFEPAPYPALSALIKLMPDATLPHAIREGLCYGISDMLSGQNQSMKFHFQQAGGVNALVSLLANFPYAALCAIGEAMTACEENKRYLEEYPGFHGLSTLLKSTNLVIDRALFEVIVEMACAGSFRQSLPQAPPSSGVRLSGPNMQNIYPIIASMVHPQALHSCLLPCMNVDPESSISLLSASLMETDATMSTTSTRHNSFSDDDMDDSLNSLNTFGNVSPLITGLSVSGSSTGSGGFHMYSPHVFTHTLDSPAAELSPNIQRTSATGIIRVPSFRNLSVDSRRTRPFWRVSSADDMQAMSSMGSSGMLHTLGGSMTSLGSGVFYIDTSSGSNSNGEENALYNYMSLGRIHFRSDDAALFVVDLISLAPPNVQQDLIITTMRMLESNPTNKQMLAKAQGLKFLLHLAHQSDEAVAPYYFRLIALLGMYDISPSEVRLLFDLACMSLRSSNSNSTQQTIVAQHRTSKHREKELQMQTLYVIGTLTERRTPPSYFNFDGFDAWLHVGSIDRFPSSRTGYTFTCWLKVNYFLNDEAGLIGWQDTTKHCVFEIYFKTFIDADKSQTMTQTQQQQQQQQKTRKLKRCLCVQSQTHPSPPEIFVFDKVSFAECGGWHHIAITHLKQQVTLYVDGKMVQSCTTLTYPRARDLEGCVARRLIVNPSTNQHAYFCGQIGVMYCLEGAWDEAACTKMYTQGSLFANHPRTIGIENKEFLVIRPDSATTPLSTPNYPPSPTTLSATPSLEDIPSLQEADITQTTTTLLNHAVSLLSTSSSSVPTVPPSSIPAPSTTQPNSTAPVGTSSSLLSNLLSIAPGTSSASSAPSTGSTSSFSPFSSPAPPSYKISTVGGVTVHFGRPLTSVIGEVGGIKLCFPFLDMGPAQQVAGLRILVGLLSHSENNKAQFRKLHGFCILYHLLCRFELSMETFDVMFDLLYDGFTPSATHPLPAHLPTPEWTFDCLTLILDMLTSSSCNDELQRHALKCMARIMGSSNEALRLCTSGRLFAMLQLTTKLTTDVSPLLGLLRMMVPSFATDDMEVLFDWMLSPISLPDAPTPPTATTPIAPSSPSIYPGSPSIHPTSQNFGLNLKAKVLEIFYEEFRQKPYLEQHLRIASGGFHVILALLEIPLENVRILALKMIGLLLNNNSKNALQFRRANGFEQILNLLSRFPPTFNTCTTLISIAIDAFAWAPPPIQPEGKKSWIPLWRSGSNTSSPPTSSPSKTDKPAESSSSRSDNTVLAPQTTQTGPASKVLAYPEIVHVVLLLLQGYLPPLFAEESADRVDLPTQVLGDLERLLVPNNMEILWGFPWLEWFWEFVVPHPTSASLSSQASSPSSTEIRANVYDRTHGLVLFIAQKMMLYEISKKSNRILAKLKEMPLDMEGFFEQVLLAVIDHFEKFPCLPNAESDNIVRNLAALYKSAEDMGLPADLTFKILTNITSLTLHNTPAIRASLKSNGLLDFRDALVIHLLRAENARGEFVCNFAFECVADHKAFRENGILYLLHMFHHTRSDPQLQATIYHILRTVIAPVEENKKLISNNYLEDPEVIEAFYRDGPPKTDHSLSSSTPSLPVLPGVPPAPPLSASTSSLPSSHSSPSIPAVTVEGGTGNNSGHFPPLSFLEWYYMDERKARREEIESRIDKHYSAVETRFVAAMQDKMKARKLKRQRAEKELQKAGGTLARTLNENEEKRRARVARGIATHSARVKDAIVGREERAVRGSDGWRAFLNKGWDAVAMAPAHAHTPVSSIWNTTPTPSYTSSLSPSHSLNTSTSSTTSNGGEGNEATVLETAAPVTSTSTENKDISAKVNIKSPS